MNIIKKELLKYIVIALPFSFVIFFLGYFHPSFDVVLYTNNIKGEGIATTSICSLQTFSPFYEVQFYFGSKLKKTTIKNINYDVENLSLLISDVDEIEIDSFDVLYLNHVIGHYEAEEKIRPGKYNNMEVSVTEDNERIHIDIINKDIGTEITLKTHFPSNLFVFAYSFALLLFNCFFAFLLMMISDRFIFVKKYLLYISGIVISVIVGCFINDSFPYINYNYFLLNLLFILSFSMAINVLTSPWVGTVCAMLFTVFAYIANYYVIALRNKPIMPADLKAIGTAIEVMGGYTFTPSWKIIIGVLIVLAYAAFIIYEYYKNKSKEKTTVKKEIKNRIISVFIGIALIMFGLNTSTFKSLETFAWDAVLLKNFHEEGMVLTFLKSAINSTVKKPDGYNQEIINDYLSEYDLSKVEGIKPTNIIMIMNEAFSDLRTVGLDENIDVMPYIDSIDENIIEGSLYVSVFGGGTCNTEFEALTGNSLAFFGTGAYPYTENITDEMFSLASYFKELGYSTDAFHANEAQNWNRNMVYPNLGFSNFHSIEDYYANGEVPYLHGHPADLADYLFIETVNNQLSKSPRFMFNVTMQNHSGYERWEDVERVESVEKYGSNLYLDTQIYLSLIKASDDEIKQLIETYKSIDEPTMVIFFGDHQPGLPAYAQNEFYTKTQSYLDWYKSKFFIWTNYETETEHNVEISANYLPYLILERGNFEMPPYIQMLKELHDKYPVISAMGVKDNEGNIYGSVNELIDDPLIKKYQYIQYANVFDEIDNKWFSIK